MDKPRIAAVILAAGQGTRLKSTLPKVLHEICGRPMLAYVFDACHQAGVRDCLAVVGHGKDLVIEAFADEDGITWIEQSPRLGTGHAVMVCREQLKEYDHALILCGDGPLIRSETIRELLDTHLAEQSVATLATAVLDDPTGYGRIWRDAEGKLLGIVEHGDCTPEQREIREVNPSYYCFQVPDLLAALDQIKPNNVKNEYYITDCLALMIEAGKKAVAISSVRPEDIYSINSRQHLAQVNAVMRTRILDRLMNDGVTIIDPANTWIDARATIGRDTVIQPFVHIDGPARIGSNCRIGSFVHLNGSTVVADNATLAPVSGGHA
ncbi:MAG: NTP transferase domain-containing protein [Phycisphaerae bacterium]|nr:NTP transferase domain-containing protein [Phycisphaerae bacterium]